MSLKSIIQGFSQCLLKVRLMYLACFVCDVFSIIFMNKQTPFHDGRGVCSFLVSLGNDGRRLRLCPSGICVFPLEREVVWSWWEMNLPISVLDIQKFSRTSIFTVANLQPFQIFLRERTEVAQTSCFRVQSYKKMIHLPNI